jgi:hypothetical protein
MFTKGNALQGGFPPQGARRVVVALVLLAVVALGSTSGVGSGGAFGSSWVGLPIVILAGLALLATTAVGLLATGHAAFAGNSLRARAAVMGIVTLVLAVIFLLPRSHDHFGPVGRVKCIDPTSWWIHVPGRRGEIARHPKRFCPWSSGGTGEMNSHGGGAASVALFAAVTGVALAVLIIAAAAGAIAARRSQRETASPNEEGDAVLLALDQSLDDLRRERDIRRAIIACYARMEQALDRSGAARRPHEAPVEYLGRVLERIAAEPGRRLTELFERAKFSLEQMGERDKDQAIAALEALRAGVSA